MLLEHVVWERQAEAGPNTGHPEAREQGGCGEGVVCQIGFGISRLQIVSATILGSGWFGPKKRLSGGSIIGYSWTTADRVVNG